MVMFPDGENVDTVLPFVTREIFAFIMDEALPEEAYKNINHIAPGILPDIDLCSDHWGAIYTLYNPGVLTGQNHNAGRGKYNSFENHHTRTQAERCS